MILALLVVAGLAIGGVVLAAALGRGADATAGATPTPGATAETETPAAGDSTAPPSTAPSSKASPAPTRTTAPAEPSPTSSDGCDASKVVVAAETDKESYGTDENPVLTLVVRNEGTTPCDVNVGTSQMQFEVTSGDERVFSSTDCQQASQDLERAIAPGGEERATFEWSRNRTVPGCTTVDEEPASGSYTVTTRLGARSSTPVEFTLQ
ncbi:MAG: Membrane lipoprotein [Micrococcaceae bacterium]|jgi:hypothetical protein|nr:Membrane lipoprotein [Micrococcaceae bacterium]